MGRLARVGEEREAERRIRRLREDPMGRRASAHGVAGGEALFTLTQVVVGPREDDLDLAEETPDDLSEAHGREGS